MKAVILAGGLGTRISEETSSRPKPMVEIGGRPILWHILKIYSCHGINDFVICLGYKGYMIKEFFANYFLHTADVTFHMQENRMDVHGHYAEPWHVTLVDTGEHTMTGGRLKRIAPYVTNEESFCMTYGDGVGNVDITALLAFHRQHGKAATLTAVQPRQRFGVLERKGDAVTAFREKAQADGDWINSGFFVLSPGVLDRIAGDATTWEREPMEELAAEGNLRAFEHTGFWQPMDTMRDKQLLEDLWAGGKAPWKIW
jgi:glucose-1-phosphate cytidylyltransferase